MTLRVDKQNPWQAVLLHVLATLQSRAKLQDLHNLAKTVASNVGTVQSLARFARSCKIFRLQSLEVANFGKIAKNFLQYLQDFGAMTCRKLHELASLQDWQNGCARACQRLCTHCPNFGAKT